MISLPLPGPMFFMCGGRGLCLVVESAYLGEGLPTRRSAYKGGVSPGDPPLVIFSGSRCRGSTRPPGMHSSCFYYVSCLKIS